LTCSRWLSASLWFACSLPTNGAAAACNAQQRTLRYMKPGFPQRVSSQSGDVAFEPTAEAPRAGEVVLEIGIVLALHLAIALAITLTLTSFGI